MQSNHPQIKTLRLETPVILAPMAGISDQAYRRIMKPYGAGLVYSEMVSANGLIREGQKTRQLLATHPDEFPFAIQLFGESPQVLSQAARELTELADVLDINLGCPVKKVVRSGAGSALLKEPRKVAAILSAVRKAYAGPLTIKIRSGWNEESLNYLEIGRIAEQEGVDALTLHPRTRSQGFSGQAQWSQLAELKKQTNIPVFGSGDIFTAQDAVRMFRETGCDAVMIGRGGYGNPWLIRRLLELLNHQPVSEPTREEKYRTVLSHLDLHRHLFGEKKTLLDMRKHLCWYARGMAGAGHFRLALQHAGELGEVYRLTHHFFHEAP